MGRIETGLSPELRMNYITTGYTGKQISAKETVTPLALHNCETGEPECKSQMESDTHWKGPLIPIGGLKT